MKWFSNPVHWAKAGIVNVQFSDYDMEGTMMAAEMTFLQRHSDDIATVPASFGSKIHLSERARKRLGLPEDVAIHSATAPVMSPSNKMPSYMFVAQQTPTITIEFYYAQPKIPKKKAAPLAASMGAFGAAGKKTSGAFKQFSKVMENALGNIGKTKKKKTHKQKQEATWGNETFLVNALGDDFFEIELENIESVYVTIDGTAQMEGLAWKRIDSGIRWMDAEKPLQPGTTVQVTYCREEPPVSEKTVKVKLPSKAEEITVHFVAGETKTKKAPKKKPKPVPNKGPLAMEAQADYVPPKKKTSKKMKKSAKAPGAATRFPAQGKRRFGGGL